MVVENKTALAAPSASSSVAKAAPDGNTLFLMEDVIILYKWLYKDVPTTWS